MTVCTQDREFLFGDVIGGEVKLNVAGQMIQTVWQEIPFYYRGIGVDAFVVMPNHFHGIIMIVGAAPPWPPSNAIKWRATTGGCPYHFIAGCCSSI